MPRVLHLLKGDDPALALAVMAQQQAAGDEITVGRTRLRFEVATDDSAQQRKAAGGE